MPGLWHFVICWACVEGKLLRGVVLHLSGMYTRRGMVVRVGVFYIVLVYVEARLSTTTPAMFMSLLGRYFVVVKSQKSPVRQLCKRHQYPFSDSQRHKFAHITKLHTREVLKILKGYPSSTATKSSLFIHPRYILSTSGSQPPLKSS